MKPDTSELEFRAWLKKNQYHFADYTPDEVARLAHYVGFEWEVIFRVLSHFQDAMNGSDFDNRSKMKFFAEFSCIDPLVVRWRELGNKLMYDKDFD